MIRRLAPAVLVAALAIAPAFAVTPGTKHALDPRRTGLPFDTLSFFSASDSVRLSGWWFDGPAGSPVIVCCPRGRGTMADLLPSVREFVHRGFTVMTFDLRDFGPGSPGESDSLRYLVFASRWVDDAEGALCCARARAGGRPVFGWGQDLGSVVAVAAAARDPRNVDAIAVEGLFRSAVEQVEFNGTAQIPEVLPRHRLYVDGRDDPVSAVMALHVPMLVVLAMKDVVTPVEVTKIVAARSQSVILRLPIPAAGHDGAELTPGYFDRLGGWFKGLAVQIKPRTTP